MKTEIKPFALRDIHYRVLKNLKRFWQVRGYCPSMRELAQMARVRSTSHLSLLLDELEIKGLIRRQKGISRSIVIERMPEEKKPGQKSGAIDQDEFRVPGGTP